MNLKPGHKFQQGVTLVEVMIVVVMLAIMLSMAMPAYQGMVARNRQATQTNDFIIAIKLARTEALRIGKTVSVLASSPVASDEFGEGWCVVEGDATAVARTCAADGIKQFSGLAGAATLNSVDNVSSLQFNSLGALKNLGGDGNRSIDLCTPGQQGRRIFITAVGRSKSHKPDDADAAKQPAC